MSKRRRGTSQQMPKPLPMPAFGAPAGGLQCAACGQWYRRKHFERRDKRTRVSTWVHRCRACIAANRQARKAAR